MTSFACEHVCHHTPCSSKVEGGQHQVLRHSESEDVESEALATVPLGLQDAEYHPYGTNNASQFAIEEEGEEEHADDETRLRETTWKGEHRNVSRYVRVTGVFD